MGSLLAAPFGLQYLFESSDLCQQLSGSLACYNIYQCRDGHYVTLVALEPRFWQAFCISVEQADWNSRQSEALPQRSNFADLAELFSSKSQAQWQQLFEKVDCYF